MAIVRAILADAEPAAMLRKPFNPVLGETARHVLAFADGDAVRSTLEQVSHHPPITAFDSRGDGFTVAGHFRATPRLAGFRVEVDLTGVRYFHVRVDSSEEDGSTGAERAGVDVASDEQNTTVGHKNATVGQQKKTTPVGPRNAAAETYASDYVGFEWHFLPRMRTCMKTSKPYRVVCESSGLAAEIEHGRGARVRGRVFRFRRRPIEPSAIEPSGTAPSPSPPSETSSDAMHIFVSHAGRVEETERLFDVSGRHDARVVVVDARTGESGVLYDAAVAHAVETRCVASDEMVELSDDEKSSERTWGRVTAAMASARWDAARREKRAVEARERDARRTRRRDGAAWRPRLFERDERAGTWRLRD